MSNETFEPSPEEVEAGLAKLKSQLDQEAEATAVNQLASTDQAYAELQAEQQAKDIVQPVAPAEQPKEVVHA